MYVRRYFGVLCSKCHTPAAAFTGDKKVAVSVQKTVEVRCPKCGHTDVYPMKSVALFEQSDDRH